MAATTGTPICDLITDLQNQPPGLTEADVTNIVNNAIAAIPPVVHPTQQLCTGPFHVASSRTSWWNGFGDVGGSNWSAISNNTGNVPNTVGNYVPVGSVIRSPDCITDMSFTMDVGNHYIISRGNLSYYWIDYRLLINGSQVLQRTFDTYWYVDERISTQTTTEGIQTKVMKPGNSIDVRWAVPASALVQVEARQRYQTVGAQATNYHRVIGGLRSQTVYNFTPRMLVTGRQ